MLGMYLYGSDESKRAAERLEQEASHLSRIHGAFQADDRARGLEWHRCMISSKRWLLSCNRSLKRSQNAQRAQQRMHNAQLVGDLAMHARR